MRWLALRYGAVPSQRVVGLGDVILSVSGAEAGHEVLVSGTRGAIRDRAAVLSELFTSVDAVLLVFTRIAKLAHLNLPELQALRPFLLRSAIEPLSVANDAHCDNADFPTIPVAQIMGDLAMPLHTVTVGPFVDPLVRADGIAEAWDAVVARAVAQLSSAEPGPRGA